MGHFRPKSPFPLAAHAPPLPGRPIPLPRPSPFASLAKSTWRPSSGLLSPSLADRWDPRPHLSSLSLPQPPAEPRSCLLPIALRPPAAYLRATAIPALLPPARTVNRRIRFQSAALSLPTSAVAPSPRPPPPSLIKCTFVLPHLFLSPKLPHAHNHLLPVKPCARSGVLAPLPPPTTARQSAATISSPSAPPSATSIPQSPACTLPTNRRLQSPCSPPFLLL